MFIVYYYYYIIGPKGSVALSCSTRFVELELHENWIFYQKKQKMSK